MREFEAQAAIRAAQDSVAAAHVHDSCESARIEEGWSVYGATLGVRVRIMWGMCETQGSNEPAGSTTSGPVGANLFAQRSECLERSPR